MLNPTHTTDIHHENLGVTTEPAQDHITKLTSLTALDKEILPLLNEEAIEDKQVYATLPKLATAPPTAPELEQRAMTPPNQPRPHTVLFMCLMVIRCMHGICLSLLDILTQKFCILSQVLLEASLTGRDECACTIMLVS